MPTYWDKMKPYARWGGLGAGLGAGVGAFTTYMQDDDDEEGGTDKDWSDYLTNMGAGALAGGAVGLAGKGVADMSATLEPEKTEDQIREEAVSVISGGVRESMELELMYLLNSEDGAADMGRNGRHMVAMESLLKESRSKRLAFSETIPDDSTGLTKELYKLVWPEDNYAELDPSAAGTFDPTTVLAAGMPSAFAADMRVNKIVGDVAWKGWVGQGKFPPLISDALLAPKPTKSQLGLVSDYLKRMNPNTPAKLLAGIQDGQVPAKAAADYLRNGGQKKFRAPYMSVLALTMPLAQTAGARSEGLSQGAIIERLNEIPLERWEERFNQTDKMVGHLRKQSSRELGMAPKERITWIRSLEHQQISNFENIQRLSQDAPGQSAADFGATVGTGTYARTRGWGSLVEGGGKLLGADVPDEGYPVDADERIGLAAEKVLFDNKVSVQDVRPEQLSSFVAEVLMSHSGKTEKARNAELVKALESAGIDKVQAEAVSKEMGGQYKEMYGGSLDEAMDPNSSHAVRSKLLGYTKNTTRQAAADLFGGFQLPTYLLKTMKTAFSPAARRAVAGAIKDSGSITGFAGNKLGSFMKFNQGFNLAYDAGIYTADAYDNPAMWQDWNDGRRADAVGQFLGSVISQPQIRGAPIGKKMIKSLMAGTDSGLTDYWSLTAQNMLSIATFRGIGEAVHATAEFTWGKGGLAEMMMSEADARLQMAVFDPEKVDGAAYGIDEDTWREFNPSQRRDLAYSKAVKQSVESQRAMKDFFWKNNPYLSGNDLSKIREGWEVFSKSTPWLPTYDSRMGKMINEGGRHELEKMFIHQFAASKTAKLRKETGDDGWFVQVTDPGKLDQKKMRFARHITLQGVADPDSEIEVGGKKVPLYTGNKKTFARLLYNSPGVPANTRERLLRRFDSLAGTPLEHKLVKHLITSRTEGGDWDPWLFSEAMKFPESNRGAWDKAIAQADVGWLHGKEAKAVIQQNSDKLLDTPLGVRVMDVMTKLQPDRLRADANAKNPSDPDAMYGRLRRGYEKQLTSMFREFKLYKNPWDRRPDAVRHSEYLANKRIVERTKKVGIYGEPRRLRVRYAYAPRLAEQVKTPDMAFLERALVASGTDLPGVQKMREVLDAARRAKDSQYTRRLEAVQADK